MTTKLFTGSTQPSKSRLASTTVGLAGVLAIFIAVNPQGLLPAKKQPPTTVSPDTPGASGQGAANSLPFATPAKRPFLSIAGTGVPAESGPSYAFRADHTAENFGYQMEIRCHQSGITLTQSTRDPLATPAWTFTLAKPQPVPASLTVEDAKATYRHSPSQEEWFINSEKGIEHGMTLTAAPSSIQQPLTMEFTVTSGLHGEQLGDNQLVFKNDAGEPTLRYEKLYAYDAKGRDIPTALSWNGDSSTISWRVDHQGFEYPITIDPVIATFSQTLSSPTSTNLNFGDSIAVVGNFMAIGVPSSNRVYFYEKSGGSWVLFSRKNFIGSPATNGGAFGGQVLMPDLDTLIVSDSSFDALTPTGGTNANQGALFVFGRNTGGDNNWGLIRQFTVTDPQLPNGKLADRLGTVISCESDTLAAVAIPDGDSYDTAIKFIYIFEKNRGGANNWGQVPGVRIQGLNFSSGFTYGATFDISGDLLVVGSSAENYQATPTSPFVQFQGAVYLYGRNQGGANQWGLLPGGRRYAPDGAAGDFFGRSVSISGDLIAIGADSVDLSGSQSDAGAVYFLSRNQGGADAWGLLPNRLAAPDAADSDRFGAFVELTGDVLAVRASSDDVAGSNDVGSVYLFERNLGGTNHFGPVPGGKFSIDNVSNIVKVNSPVFLSSGYLVFSTDPTQGFSAVSIVNLSGTTGSGDLGLIRFTPQGVVNFTPAAAGTYQLRTSTNLTTWANQGAPQTGAANVALTWNTGTPGSEAKRFYRVESP